MLSQGLRGTRQRLPAYSTIPLLSRHGCRIPAGLLFVQWPECRCPGRGSVLSLAGTGRDAALSVATIALFRKYQKSHPVITDQPELNRRSRQYIGRTFTLQGPIVNGVGVLHVDDTTWRIVGGDLPAGQNITVVDVDGVLLKVEKHPG